MRDHYSGGTVAHLVEHHADNAKVSPYNMRDHYSGGMVAHLVEHHADNAKVSPIQYARSLFGRHGGSFDRASR